MFNSYVKFPEGKQSKQRSSKLGCLPTLSQWWPPLLPHQPAAGTSEIFTGHVTCFTKWEMETT